MSPSGIETIVGSMPKQKTFTVTSIFNSGLADFDSNIALINLDTLDDFFNFESKDRNLEIYLKDPKNIETQKDFVQEIFNEKFVYSWADMNSSLFSALKVERNVMFIILSLIIITVLIAFVAFILRLPLLRSASPAESLIGKMLLLKSETFFLSISIRDTLLCVASNNALPQPT